MAEAKYQKYLITTPLLIKPTDGHKTKGMDSPSRTYINDQLIPESNLITRMTWIWNPCPPALVSGTAG